MNLLNRLTTYNLLSKHYELELGLNFLRPFPKGLLTSYFRPTNSKLPVNALCIMKHLCLEN